MVSDRRLAQFGLRKHESAPRWSSKLVCGLSLRAILNLVDDQTIMQDWIFCCKLPQSVSNQRLITWITISMMLVNHSSAQAQTLSPLKPVKLWSPDGHSKLANVLSYHVHRYPHCAVPAISAHPYEHAWDIIIFTYSESEAQGYLPQYFRDHLYISSFSWIMQQLVSQLYLWIKLLLQEHRLWSTCWILDEDFKSAVSSLVYPSSLQEH